MLPPCAKYRSALGAGRAVVHKWPWSLNSEPWRRAQEVKSEHTADASIVNYVKEKDVMLSKSSMMDRPL